jgi:hypothetical protein
MNLPSAPEPEEDYRRRDDVGGVTGSALAPMGKAAPAHWLFWSYFWRYALLFSVPLSIMGMFIGMSESTGYLDLAGLDMVAHIARSGVWIGVFGLVIGMAVGLIVFIVTTPARRLWAAHRAAGWTTAQCNHAYRRQKYEVRTLRMQARLRELGLEPMPPRSDVPPGPGPVQRGDDTPSARHRADPPWMPVLARARTLALFATLLATFGIVLTVLFSPLLDRIDVQRFRCEVVSAEPRTSSGGSRGSASTASVLIKTSNCGHIVVSRGVSFDNRQEVASSFEPGSEYDFEIGWYSRVVMTDILRGLPTADHYRLVNAPPL